MTETPRTIEGSRERTRPTRAEVEDKPLCRVGLFSSDTSTQVGAWRNERDVAGRYRLEIFDFGGHRSQDYDRAKRQEELESCRASLDAFAIDVSWPNEDSQRFGLIDAMELCVHFNSKFEENVPILVLFADALPEKVKWFYEEARIRFAGEFAGGAPRVTDVPGSSMARVMVSPQSDRPVFPRRIG